MVRTIRVLAVAGLVAVALAAWMAYSHVNDVSTRGDIMWWAPQFTFATGVLMSYSAGLLTLSLALPQRQRPWSAALLASLILNAYWSLAFWAVWWMLNPTSSDGALILSTSLSVKVIDVVSYGLAPAGPAVLALGYTVHAARLARLAREAPPAIEEQGSLDITIEPIGSKAR
jgi:hypothetical protein